MAEIKAGLRFTQPKVQVRDQHGNWHTVIWRVNRITKSGTVYFGYDGESRSGWKISVEGFQQDLDNGRKVLLHEGA